MTEEIYIDGVNVAGCKFYVKHCIEDCYDERVDLYKYCQMFGSECTNEKDCYYKQLKRLEQENEKLRKENRELKVFFDNAAKKNTNLENKMKEYGEQYNELYWISDQLLKDKTKYKTALEEIRKISQYEINELTDSSINGGRYLEIIDKLNEVLG